MHRFNSDNNADLPLFASAHMRFPSKDSRDVDRFSKASRKLTCVALVIPLIFIVSCSKSSQRDIVPAGNGNALIMGGSCDEIDIFTDEDGPTTTTNNGSSAFTCDELLDEDIDEVGTLPTGSGDIDLAASKISVDAAAVETFPKTEYENHLGIQLYIHDGVVKIRELRFESGSLGVGITRHRVDWGIYDGTFVLSVELASSGGDEFNVGTFEFVGSDNPNSPDHIGRSVMFHGTVFLDANDSGTIDSVDEVYDISDGYVSIMGEKPNWIIDVDVLLSNGESMTGSFSGDYIEVPIADAASN